MKNIFNYSNYRFFLRDWLSEKKATGNPMTYEALGEIAGFTSKGFLTQILQGKTNLPKKMVEKLITGLSLGKKEGKYFTLLVQFNQAKRASLRSEMHNKIRDEFRAEAKALAIDQFEYYQKWYYSALRSLIGYYPFQGDYVDLGKQLEPNISSAQAKRGLNLLEKLGLIYKQQDGYFDLTDRLITSGEDFISHGVIHFQRQTMDLAKVALEKFPKNSRTGATLTLGLSLNGYAELENKFRNLRQELMDLAKFDQNIDRVIQVNLHAFPMTVIPKERKKK